MKFLQRLPGTGKRLYQFTAIDDCTRIRVLKIFDACNQRTAIRFVDDVADLRRTIQHAKDNLRRTGLPEQLWPWVIPFELRVGECKHSREQVSQ